MSQKTMGWFSSLIDNPPEPPKDLVDLFNSIPLRKE